MLCAWKRAFYNWTEFVTLENQIPLEDNSDLNERFCRAFDWFSVDREHWPILKRCSNKAILLLFGASFHQRS